VAVLVHVVVHGHHRQLEVLALDMERTATEAFELLNVGVVRCFDLLSDLVAFSCAASIEKRRGVRNLPARLGSMVLR
jgi:hypothetical protein